MGPGGVNNKYANNMQWVFHTVRYAMYLLDLVEKVSFCARTTLYLSVLCNIYETKSGVPTNRVPYHSNS